MSDNKQRLGDIVASYIDDLGFAIIPLRPRSKEPATAHGLKDWTNDSEGARDGFNKRPEYNVAVVLGKPSGGVIAIDVDVDDEQGYSGFDYLNKWESEHGELPETLTAITGRGGCHMYYRADRDIRPSVNEDLHIDIRGDGSYAMLPPSTHPNGNVMEWENNPADYEIADADESVYSFIKSVQPKTETKKFKLPNQIKPGKRNDVLYKYGCSMRAKNMDDDVIYAALVGANVARCKPPLDDAEITKIYKSVMELDEGLSEEAKKSQNRAKPRVDKQFNHAKFAAMMIRDDHVCFIDGAPSVWTGFNYETGKRAIEAKMLDHDDTIKDHNRREVYKYIELKAPRVNAADRRFIAFNNCVLDVFTMTTMPLTPDLRIPNVIPHRWNPDAESSVVTETFIKIAQGDTDTLQNLLEIIGICMYRGTELSCCPILFGVGQNGKSTYLNMLHRILGEDNVSSLDVSTIGERFQSVALMGKLANIGDDISNEFVSGSKAAIVKKIITGDYIQAEYKGGETFTYKPYCTLVFSCNEFPRIGDSSHGMLRRLHPVKFDAKFKVTDPDYDPYIEDKLTAEESLETAIRLGIDALVGALNNKSLTRGESSEEQISNIKLTNSTVYQFAVDELRFGEDDQEDIYHVSTTQLYERYINYCERMKIKTPVYQVKFSTEMQSIYDCEIGRERKEFVGGEKHQIRCFVPRIDRKL